MTKFSIAWSSHCGCCYHYTLFVTPHNGKTKLLKRFFGIKKYNYMRLLLAIGVYITKNKELIKGYIDG